MKKVHIKAIKWHVRRCVDIEFKHIKGAWVRDEYGDRYVLITGAPQRLGRIALVYDEGTDQWYGADPKRCDAKADIKCWHARVDLRHTIKYMDPEDMTLMYYKGVGGVVAQRILAQAT